ncbi:MAG: DUF2971 domain-containing protein, partial [Candidatus Brocadiae bacterium]|nr:DUF2971 domain-containing protein [Candidatus Brocadiia bacterium]
CRFVLSFDAATPQKEQRYVKFLRGQGVKASDARRRARGLFGDRTRRQVAQWEQERLAQFTEQLRNQVGMVCLSEISNDLLMWSHYADGHRGVCVEFTAREPRHVDFIGSAQPVTYKDEIPQVKLYTDDTQILVRAAVLTKASHWAYEKEWRDIDMVLGPGVKNLPGGVISGVIFGCRMTDKHRNWIRDLVAGRCPPVVPYEARQREGAFALDVRPVE